MSRIFVVSDTHFWHTNIIYYGSRPFSCIEHMNQQLVTNWNKVVKNTDTVYHLGDVVMSNREDFRKNILPKLNGKIVFIRGNHDNLSMSHIYNIIINFKGYKIELLHNPDDVTLDCKYVIHGHIHKNTDGSLTHGDYKIKGIKYFNANVEFNNYKPVLINEIIGRWNNE